jgi:hypothetical protein
MGGIWVGIDGWISRTRRKVWKMVRIIGGRRARSGTWRKVWGFWRRVLEEGFGGRLWGREGLE